MPIKYQCENDGTEYATLPETCKVCGGTAILPFDPDAGPETWNRERARSLVEALRKFRESLIGDFDDNILAAFSPLQKDRDLISSEEWARYELARKRLKALTGFRKALKTEDDEVISGAYNSVLIGCKLVFPEEAERLALALERLNQLQKFRTALVWDEDERIVAIYPRLLENGAKLSKTDHKKYQGAIKRISAMEKLLEAFSNGDERQIHENYDPILDTSPKLSRKQREQLQLAFQCVEMARLLPKAIQEGDEEAISNLYNPDLVRPFTGLQLRDYELIHRVLLVRALQQGKFDEFLLNQARYTTKERSIAQRVLNEYRTEGLALIRQLLWLEDDAKIANIYSKYDSLFKLVGGIEKFEIERINTAQKRVEALLQIRWALALGTPDQLEATYQTYGSIVLQSRNFSKEERDKLSDKRQKSFLSNLREAFSKRDIKHIVEAGQKALEGGCILTDNDFKKLYKARITFSALISFESALTQNDDLVIVSSYNAELLDKESIVTPLQKKRLKLSQKRVENWYKLRAALADQDEITLGDCYDPDLFRDSSLLDEFDRKQCELAWQQKKAWGELAKAFEKKDLALIQQKFEINLFETSSYLNAENNRLLKISGQKRALEDDLFIAQTENDGKSIEQAAINILEVDLSLPDDLKWKLVLEQKYIEMEFEELKRLLKNPEADNGQLAFLGRSYLTREPDKLNESDRGVIQEAIIRTGAKQRLKKAFEKGDLALIAGIYQSDWMDSLEFTQIEHHLIEMAREFIYQRETP